MTTFLAYHFLLLLARPLARVMFAIGIFFGVFPAKKVADLSSMEAIRYE
jgi:ABC-type antimicrobial peptide transport system permease subunit